MARLGVLGRWIPAFAQVSGRMQFDLFHVYTVDQHTLAVLPNLASFGQAAPEDDRFATAREVRPTLRQTELPLLAGLFSTIPQGRGGPPSEVRAEAAQAFAAPPPLPTHPPPAASTLCARPLTFLFHHPHPYP